MKKTFMCRECRGLRKDEKARASKDFDKDTFGEFTGKFGKVKKVFAKGLVGAVMPLECAVDSVREMGCVPGYVGVYCPLRPYQDRENS